MKLILTEKVNSLGNVGEIVNVSPGYARNFLIPNKFAVVADESNQRQLTNQMKALTKKVEAEKALAVEIKNKIDGLVIELTKKVGSNGRLFGTVTNTELAKELAARDIVVERRLIVIENSIKAIGTFDVKVKLFSGVEALFQVKVVMDAKQIKEMQAKQAAAEKRAQKKKEAPEAVEGEAVEGEAEAVTEEITEEV